MNTKVSFEFTTDTNVVFNISIYFFGANKAVFDQRILMETGNLHLTLHGAWLIMVIHATDTSFYIMIGRRQKIYIVF